MAFSQFDYECIEWEDNRHKYEGIRPNDVQSYWYVDIRVDKKRKTGTADRLEGAVELRDHFRSINQKRV